MSDHQFQSKLSRLIHRTIDDKGIELKSKQYFEVNGEPLRKEKLFEVLIDLKMLKDFKLMDDYVEMSDKEKSKLIQTFSIKTEAILEKRKNDEVINKIQSNLPESRLDPYNYVPFIDLQTDTEVLLNKSSGKVSKLNPKSWVRLLNEDEKKVLYGTVRLGMLVFDPYQLEPFKNTSFESQEVLRVNLYEPPAWMLDDRGVRIELTGNEISNLECPSEIMEFMEFLVPENDCREFVFNWMHTALVKRCETYLVLNGKKGAGKGIFCGQIMSALMGENNHRIAPESILDSIFNASLDKTRLLVMDEVRVDNDKKLNKLK